MADLYDLLSNNGGGLDGQAQIDHPLCEECTDSLLETMDQQLKCGEDEAQQYQSYLQKLDQVWLLNIFIFIQCTVFWSNIWCHHFFHFCGQK